MLLTSLRSLTLSKLSAKNRKQLEIINKSSKFSPVPLQATEWRPARRTTGPHRQTLCSHEIDEENKLIRLLDDDHHDNIYK